LGGVVVGFGGGGGFLAAVGVDLYGPDRTGCLHHGWCSVRRCPAPFPIRHSGALAFRCCRVGSEGALGSFFSSCRVRGRWPCLALAPLAGMIRPPSADSADRDRLRPRR
jgi:hypothetical protein